MCVHTHECVCAPWYHVEIRIQLWESGLSYHAAQGADLSLTGSFTHCLAGPNKLLIVEKHTQSKFHHLYNNA